MDLFAALDFNFLDIKNTANGMGKDLFVDAAESASFPLPGTGKREGGNKTQPSIT